MRTFKQTTASTDIAADIATLKEQLASVIATLSSLASAAGVGEAGSYTIREFSARNRLSESQYHKLRREGRGPRLMSTGSVGKRISAQAEDDWVKAREAEAAAEAAIARPETSQ
jgi:hypothetical protein